MTPTEWIVDAVNQLRAWETKHATLDRERAKLPSTEDLAALRATGQNQAANMYSDMEHGIADVMRELDAQVKRTVQDVIVTAQAFDDADRAPAADALRELGHGRANWAAALLLEGAPVTTSLAVRVPR